MFWCKILTSPSTNFSTDLEFFYNPQSANKCKLLFLALLIRRQIDLGMLLRNYLF